MAIHQPPTLEGRVITSSDPDYETARKVFNGLIDRRPSVIARVAATADVVSAINYARDNGLPLAIRGGGHNVAGNAVCNGGLVIDFSDLHEVRVDADARTAKAQPGATWYDFDLATQAHHLATTGGLVSNTGVAGFTLGGGIGWLVRKHGLACDNLIGAEVVTADGKVVHASETENPDLLWALRGGGGNFGVVSSFEFRLHPLGRILGGIAAHTRDRARDVLRFFRAYSADAPDELTLVAVLMTTPEGHPAVGIGACYSGPSEEAERVIKPLREYGPPLVDRLAVMPYTVLQSMMDISAPFGSLNYWKADFMAELSDRAIDLLIEQANAMRSALSQIHIHQLGGSMARVTPEATSFHRRDAGFVYNLLGLWKDRVENELHTSWAKGAFAALRPVSMGGAYVNFLGDDGDERVRAAYGPHYQRLARLKKRYDPTNLFRLNQNIQPM